MENRSLFLSYKSINKPLKRKVARLPWKPPPSFLRARSPGTSHLLRVYHHEPLGSHSNCIVARVRDIPGRSICLGCQVWRNRFKKKSHLCWRWPLSFSTGIEAVIQTQLSHWERIVCTFQTVIQFPPSTHPASYSCPPRLPIIECLMMLPFSKLTRRVCDSG